MIELSQLENLLAVEKYGTLSAAAEHIHLSQPALSRSMQKLDDELRVSLFDRQKNRVSLNAAGQLAVEYARRVVEQAGELTRQVRAFDRSRHTISVGSCAPAPLWEIVPRLTELYPGMAVSSEMQDCGALLDGLHSRAYQLIVMPEPVDDPALLCIQLTEEHLYFSLPPAHSLSSAKVLRFADLDGESMLLLAHIGFWYGRARKNMPQTLFLTQDEPAAFDELTRMSALPFFTSDLSLKRDGMPENRVCIPISDPDAHVTYYCVCLSEQHQLLSRLLQHAVQ